MEALRKLFIRYVARLTERGENALEAVDREMDLPWCERGLIDAVHRFDLGTGTGGEAFLLATAYEAGALAALMQAKAVLSDPSVRGHEAVALKMIAEGAGHAAIVAHLKSRRDHAPATGAVVKLDDHRET